MTSPFIKSMQDALAKILNAQTPSDRGVAEAEMAELIRAQYRQGRQPAFDAKAAQVGRDE